MTSVKQWFSSLGLGISVIYALMRIKSLLRSFMLTRIHSHMDSFLSNSIPDTVYFTRISNLSDFAIFGSRYLFLPLLLQH
jgi:hypothetical protein